MPTPEPTTRSLRLQSVELQKALLTRAAKEEIWIQPEGELLVRYEVSKHSQIIQLLQDISRDHLPIDRSISYTPRLQEFFKKELIGEGITFKEIVYDGRKWIVWSEVDTTRVRLIQERIKKIAIERPELLN